MNGQALTAEGYLQQGLAQRSINRLDDAIGSFRRAIDLRPDLAEAHYQLGYTLSLQGRLDEALVASQRAVALDPAHVDAHCNIGYALLHRGRVDEAISSLEQALSIRPDYVKALNNLGTAYIRQGDAEAAAACFQRIVTVQPGFAPAHSSLLMVMHNLPDCPPEEQFAAHRRFAEQFETPLMAMWPKHTNPRDPERRLRIGYVSPDFQLHSVALFIEPVLASRDKERFEVYAYYNHVTRDRMTEHIASLVDHWIPCAGMSDEQLSRRIQSDGIDILIDLAGHTAGNRLLTFARKPAPVQVTYLGYPSTTGLRAMDYRLTTADVDPPGSEDWYSERLYRLPRTLWSFRPMQGGMGTGESAAASRRGFVTFGSMNTYVKVSPRSLALWCDVMRAVPKSRMVMTNVPEGSARAALYARFAASGIASDRLSLHDRLPDEQFRTLLRQIDIALDPFPYNGTTTTCESLAMGIPVISLRGDRSVSRSGYALLKTAGLEGLCGRSVAAYERVAVKLSRNINRLAELRARVPRYFFASSLSKGDALARDIEAAYRQMWTIWCGS
jgi:protein O-GlcNAc transferase